MHTLEWRALCQGRNALVNKNVVLPPTLHTSFLKYRIIALRCGMPVKSCSPRFLNTTLGIPLSDNALKSENALLSIVHQHIFSTVDLIDMLMHKYLSLILIQRSSTNPTQTTTISGIWRMVDHFEIVEGDYGFDSAINNVKAQEFCGMCRCKVCGPSIVKLPTSRTNSASGIEPAVVSIVNHRLSFQILESNLRCKSCKRSSEESLPLQV